MINQPTGPFGLFRTGPHRSVRQVLREYREIIATEWAIRRQDARRECTCSPRHGIVHLAVDRNGERYTEHTCARRGDPWFGAFILTSSMIESLRKDGLLPLREIR